MVLPFIMIVYGANTTVVFLLTVEKMGFDFLGYARRNSGEWEVSKRNPNRQG